MTKKTAIIILIVVAVLAGLFLAYMTFFPKSENPIDQANNNNDGGLTNPFGNSGSNNQNNNDQNNNQSNGGDNIDGVVIPRLRQISNTSISGFNLLDRVAETTNTLTENDSDISEEDKDENETVYRFIERGTGNIYETTSRKLSLDRITNTTIPRIQEAMFFASGNGAILRYLGQNNTIETFIGNVSDNKDNTVGENQINENPAENITDQNIKELAGIFLPKDIDSITKSPTEDRFFYTKDGRGYTFGTNNIQTQTLIFENSITEITSNWGSKNIWITTKPSYLAEGFLFRLPTTGGSMIKILDNKNGLITKINSNETKVLYSQTSNRRTVTGVYDLVTKTDTTLSLSTFADKCVWSNKNVNTLYCAEPTNLPEGEYPDLWYQGVASFTDNLVKINLDTDEKTTVWADFPIVFDIIEPKLSENEDFLVFVNKKDLNLWSLDLVE